MSRLIISIYVLKQVITTDPYKTQYYVLESRNKKEFKKIKREKEENKPELRSNTVIVNKHLTGL